MTAVDTSPAFSQPKVVEKAFGLPIVSDSYSYGVSTVSSLTSSLPPYLSTSLASLPPYLSTSLASLTPYLSSHLSSLQALGEERLPGVVTAKLNTARDQVTGGVHYLDSTLCDGLDQLLVKVPSLTSPTPALYLSTREAAVSQLTLASTYLASFTLTQLALKVSDSGLETADGLLKLAPASYSSRCESIVSGLKAVRTQVDIVRKEGARINGTKKVANMESSSLLSVVSEVFGINYVLDILGLAEVIAKAEAPGGAVDEDSTEKLEAAKIEAAKIEAAKIEAAKIEAAKIEAAKIEAAKIEAVKIEAAKIEAAKTEAAKTEAAKIEAAKIEAAMVEAAKIEVAKIEAAKIEAAKIEAAKIEAAKIEAAKIEAAKIEAAKIEAAKIEAAIIEAANIEAAKVEAANVEAAFEVVEQDSVVGTVTVQKEGKKGKKSFKN